MQNAMRERQMSMQLAGAREMFYWLASFYGIATVAMFAGSENCYHRLELMNKILQINKGRALQNLCSIVQDKKKFDLD